MAHGEAKFLVLLSLIAVLIDIAEYSSPDYRRQTCEQKIVDCGEFIPPKQGAVTYSCKFNRKLCRFTCDMKCPDPSSGITMTISNKRHARESYYCHHGHWKRLDRPKAFCKAKMSVIEVSQNLHHIQELNKLGAQLFNSSFVYLGMASFFERADVALPGFSKLMTDLWKTELDHGRAVISYVNKRGGYINFEDIPRPTSHEDLLVKLRERPAQEGLEMALSQNKEINQKALNLQKTSMEKKNRADPHLKFFVEDRLLSEKVGTIKKLADLLARLQSFSDEEYPVGQYSMDLELRE